MTCVLFVKHAGDDQQLWISVSRDPFEFTEFFSHTWCWRIVAGRDKRDCLSPSVSVYNISISMVLVYIFTLDSTDRKRAGTERSLRLWSRCQTELSCRRRRQSQTLLNNCRFRYAGVYTVVVATNVVELNWIYLLKKCNNTIKISYC